jgi:short-subunit dehydrogenase
MSRAHRFRSVLITGASGGLGAALARRLAGPGQRLVLGGRDAIRLEAAAAACRALGADVATAEVDVTDAAAMRDWVVGADAAAPLDLVVANAGITGETGLPGDATALARRIYEVNVLGTLNTVEPLLPRMRRRRAGQIGLVASLAGFRGMPRGPAYSGSKAALITQGAAWRAALRPSGIGVSVACPGYVRTAMTDRHGFRMPLLVDAETAAARIADGFAHDRARILFPWPLAVAGWLFRALPQSWTEFMVPGPRPAEPRP